ncbi:peptidyl-tRNA hydrolase [compost metagenome]
MADSVDNELKMWLVVRSDIVIPAGKLAGQSGHAFEGITSYIYETGGKLLETYRQYKADNTPKITVTCKNLAALERAEQECDAAGIASYKVTDAGRTVFGEPTVTVLALGPAYRSELPKFIQRFQLMKDDE